MSTMNISLPETLKSFVDEQVSKRGYGTSSEYVRELIPYGQKTRPSPFPDQNHLVNSHRC